MESLTAQQMTAKRKIAARVAKGIERRGCC